MIFEATIVAIIIAIPFSLICTSMIGLPAGERFLRFKVPYEVCSEALEYDGKYFVFLRAFGTESVRAFKLSDLPTSQYIRVVRTMEGLRTIPCTADWNPEKAIA